MQHLSLWAKKNPIKSRWFIALNRAILGYGGYLLGLMLLHSANVSAENIFIISAILYLLGFFFYPMLKKGRSGRPQFARQKTCDALLVASSFVFYIGFGNWLSEPQPAAAAPQTEVLQSAISKERPSQRNKFRLKEWTGVKYLKERAKRTAKFIKKGTKELEGYKILLLVLASMAIVLVLGYITAALACTLSCNGQEGAAVSVAVLGCAGTVLLVGLMWRNAIRKAQYEEVRNQKPPVNIPSPDFPAGKPEEIVVTSPNVEVCLEIENGSDNAFATLIYNGEYVAENMVLTGQPICHNIAVGEGNNPLAIHTPTTAIGERIKISIVDGGIRKSFYMEPLKGSVVRVVLKR